MGIIAGSFTNAPSATETTPIKRITKLSDLLASLVIP
jgi:hypothetical protein